MPRMWGTATGPSTICGGYTEQMIPPRDEGRSAAGPGAGRLRVTSEPIAPSEAVAAVSAPDAGAVATFFGLVRDHNAGRRVLYLEYECYEPLATKAFSRIVAEALDHWPGARVAIVHRVGRLQIGETSVVIAAASAHRADAFAACRYAIERVKQIAPIWKREYFEGGEVWIEGAIADPDNRDARTAALARACA